MNKTSLLMALMAIGSMARADDAAKPACCAAEATTASCCAETKPAAPLTARSIYQLDAVWTNDAGEHMSLADLRGEPVIVAMFFAQCEYACPMLVSDIERVRADLPAEVRRKARVVLVSFDTARDTPAVLNVYRKHRGLDAKWTLLRGDSASVQELAMILGVKFKQDPQGQFAHSNLITVLNAEGEIAQQRAGLQGDVSELVRAVVQATR